MRFFLVTIFLFFAACSFSQIQEVLPDPKNPPRLYNDFTDGENFLTSDQENALETKLRNYNDTTSTQIAIVIVESLHGYDANKFATELGEKWGVGGQKQFDNGIVILISTGGGEGERDAYIATGRGMEGAIPDMVAASIVDNAIIENFKSGNYYRGLDEATDDIIKAAAGEYKAPQGYGKKQSGKWGGAGIIFFIVMIILFSIIGSGRGRGGGGGGRGLGAGWIIGSMLGGMSGRSGGGGGWSGGGGGGFGGFGGGSFGGGGAGGKW